MALKIKNIAVAVGGKKIITGFSFTLPPGQVHAIMGPNGSGKSTLANALAGHPKYTITAGTVALDKKNIAALSPDKRARLGLFLSMQYPPEIAGVSVASFLRLAKAALTGTAQNPLQFHETLTKKMAALKMPAEFARRYLNLGFSGGEKKRLEILQLAVLEPRYAILDETDSGLDVDALKIVAEGINNFRGPNNGTLLITHYNRILQYVRPDVVHIMIKGRIVKTGGPELADDVEKHGYAQFL